MGRRKDNANITGADFNPPIPCGMGPDAQPRRASADKISIHPSRVGWDIRIKKGVKANGYFNPPIPCGMGLSGFQPKIFLNIFQSTHPVWDGTPKIDQFPVLAQISIHPSRVGWDEKTRLLADTSAKFQSTHPVWDGT